MCTKEDTAMQDRKKKPQIRFVFKRSSRLTKLVILVTVVVSVLALLVLRSATLDAQKKVDAWRAEAQKQEQEQSQLEEMMGNLGSIEGIKDIAENILGLTDPDSIVIQPEN